MSADTGFYGAPTDLDDEAARQLFAETPPDDYDAPPEDDDNSATTLINTPFDEPDAKLAGEKKPRTVRAKTYERKTRTLLSKAFRISISHERTLADGAAILMYGPTLAEAAGDLAAEDARFAKAIDFLTETSDNAYANFIAAAIPLAAQILRDHEPSIAEASLPGLRVPFTKGRKRILTRFKIKFPLGRKIFHNMTHDPAVFTETVYTRPDIRIALEKQGIQVVAKSR